MESKALKDLAINQLSALANLARDTGNVELQHQFQLFSLSLGQEATIPPAPAPHVEPRRNEDFDDYYDDEDNDEDYYDDDLEEDIIPEGFDTLEEYNDFLDSQPANLTTQTVENEETGEEDEIRAISVAGVIPDGEGGYKEVGSLPVFDEEDDDYFDEEEVDVINVKLTRAEGELTGQDVQDILDNPQSRMMLDVFGRDYRVLRTADPSVKVISFNIDNDNLQSRRMSQMVTSGNLVRFGGRAVFPRIGVVTSEPIIRN